jgi:hypothetical protein
MRWIEHDCDIFICFSTKTDHNKPNDTSVFDVRKDIPLKCYIAVYFNMLVHN